MESWEFIMGLVYSVISPKIILLAEFQEMHLDPTHKQRVWFAKTKLHLVLWLILKFPLLLDINEVLHVHVKLENNNKTTAYFTIPSVSVNS